MSRSVGLHDLDEIVRDTIRAVERAREQIFAIAESARMEYERVQAEAAEIRSEAQELIRLVDCLERKEHSARRRLAEVSKNFSAYGEDEISAAYEQAKDCGVELQVARERERQLRRRRDDLEVRQKQLQLTVKRAEELVSNVGIVMDLLGGRLQRLSKEVADIRQKRDLGLSIIRAQEDERRRLARDIHDGPGQLLANVIMRVDMCQRLLEGDRNEVRAELDRLRDMVRQSLDDVRKVIFDLRPMALDDFGLLPALRTYLKNVEEHSDLVVEAMLFGDERRLDSTLEAAVFRLVQEATTNVLKHAGASKLAVKLELGSDTVRAIIRDDGCGFDPTGASAGGGYGLLNMRERVQLLNGRFAVQSSPGAGTRIEALIPIGDHDLGGAT